MARAGALLILTAITALALVLGLEMGQPPGAGTFPVEIVGPDGTLFSGNVTTGEATAYSVLAVAAAQGGLAVEAQGRGEDLIVLAIDGHRNGGSKGWCYAVWEDRWVRPPHSAAVAGLTDGQAVRWSYEERGCGPLG